MSLAIEAIRTAIAELMEGTIGSVKTVPSGTFLRGTFEGQPPQASRAKTLQTSTARHRFDVELGAIRNHPSTSLSTLGNHRLAWVDVTVRVKSKLSTAAEATQRATDIATIMSDCDVAANALAYPHNLTATAASVATGIVGGCMRESQAGAIPRVNMQQSWGNYPEATTTITGQLIVHDTPVGPLDALSAADVARIRYGHWVGGALLGSYTGAVGVVRRADTDATSEFTTIAEMLAFVGASTSGFLSETRDQFGGNHLVCSVEAAQAQLCSAGAATVLDDEDRLAYRISAYNTDYRGYTAETTLDLPADASAMTVYHNAWDLADPYGMLAWAFSVGSQPAGAGDWPAMAYSGSGSGTAVLLAYDHPTYPAYTYWDAPATPRWMRVVIPDDADTSDATYSYNGTALTSPTFDPDGPLSRTAATHFVYAADRPGALTASALIVVEGELSAEGDAIVAAFFESVKAA